MEIVKKEVKTLEVVTERYYLCDKCGNRIEKDTYDAFEFELEYTTGTSYPEGADGDKWSLELCSECAPKAIKLLEENGYKVQHTEFNW